MFTKTYWILSQFICSSNYLVINIGEVSNIAHFVSQMLKISVENIEGDIDASVANMAKVVSGYAANVNPDFALHFWYKHLFLSTHGVVEPQVRRGPIGVGIAVLGQGLERAQTRQEAIKTPPPLSLPGRRQGLTTVGSDLSGGAQRR
uniref:Uncharacterized protein MANES_03G012700 n=1 Tax=Rhizophora mucronata TaxID=61149 RepID=A0A2P2LL38_RHIMU